ncbi:ABC transporter permease subunit [Mycoplasma cottewii]|uniref:ABC transporter permease subunit n=1 Tax=Mycoplasma cottewii TaxID=51364 RepID=A0ABY5TWU4_9MOLU|nr:ABC transporter permease subunit [Mycoplasma cottewii]UWD35025.1 ABC transporter permease subunit [Mycoplasma cottewii]
MFIKNKTFKVGNNFTKRPKKVFITSFLVVSIAIILLGFILLDSEWLKFFQNIDQLNELISNFFKWDFADWSESRLGARSFLSRVFALLLETITYSFFGTFIGVILCFPVALLAARSIIKNNFINQSARIFLSVFRTIPTFAFAIIVKGFFDTVSSVIAVGVIFFSFSVAGKLFFEKIEQIDVKVYTSLQSTGTTRIQAFRKAVIPQISRDLLSISLYALETNIRYLSIVATAVGITSFGGVIQETIGNSEYNKTGFLLTLFSSVILMIELLIIFTKKYVLEDKDQVLEYKIINKSLKAIRKIDNTNALKFYVNHILVKDINDKLSKLTDKNEIQHLKKIRREKIREYIAEHRKNVKQDKLEYKTLLKNTDNDLFIKIDSIDQTVRIDQKTTAKLNFFVLKAKEELKNVIDASTKLELKEFKENLTVEQTLKSGRKNYIKRLVFGLILISMFIYSTTTIDFKLASSQQAKDTGKVILEILNINWRSLILTDPTNRVDFPVVSLLWEALSMAIVATFIGGIIAFILGLLSSTKVTNKYVSIPFMFITTVMRSIPTYMYAYVFVFIVGFGPFPGMLALVMGSIGMLTKYNREIYERINMKIIYQLKSMGLSWWQVFRHGVLAQTKNETISYIIYRFELNFKEVAALGIVSAGNIGFIMNSYFRDRLFSEFGAVIFGLIIFTLVIENISTTLRKKFLEDKNLKFIDWIINKYRHYKFPVYKAKLRLFNKPVLTPYFEAEAFNSYAKQEKWMDTLIENGKTKQEIYNELKEYENDFRIYRKNMVSSINYKTKQDLETAKTNYTNTLNNLKQEFVVKKQKLNEFKLETENQIKLLDNQELSADQKHYQINDLKAKYNLEKQELINIKNLIRHLKHDYKKTKLYAKQIRRIKLLNLDY